MGLRGDSAVEVIEGGRSEILARMQSPSKASSGGCAEFCGAWVGPHFQGSVSMTWSPSGEALRGRLDDLKSGPVEEAAPLVERTRRH